MMKSNSKLFDLRRVRYFVAVCEAGGFSQASRTLNVAQSALSLHVANLEGDLGLKLLVRGSRGAMPTEAGERLLATATAALELFAQAEDDVRALAHRTAGPAMVGLSYTIIEVVGMTLIEDVLKELHSVKLRIIEGHSEMLNRSLMLGELDLALTYVPLTHERVESVPLLEEQLFCLGSPKLLGDDRPITFEEVLDLPIAAPGRRLVMNAMYQSPDVQTRIAAKSLIEIEGMSTMKQYVMRGMGCCIQSRAFAASEIAAGELVARPVVVPEIHRTAYLSALRARLASRAVAETRRLLLRAVAAGHASGLWPGKLLDDNS